MELSVMLWLSCFVLAQSAIAMAVLFIQMAEEAPEMAEFSSLPSSGMSLADLLHGTTGQRKGIRNRRSVFGDFGSFDTNSWFTWGDEPEGTHQGSASDFPQFGSFSFPLTIEEDATIHSFGEECCKGRSNSGVGPLFITNVKGVPDETKNKFNKPEIKTTEGRRSHYGLNKPLRTPQHAYSIVEKIPFFDTFDHESAVLTLVHFRSKNKIPLLKLMSLRPHFPFYIPS